MKSMKRYMWVVPAVALLVAALFMMPGRFAAAPPGVHANGIRLWHASQGVVVYTAAINSNGSVANCWGCDKWNTGRIDKGLYQVAFKQKVTANLGFWRWVQVDTLGIYSINNVSCTTTDGLIDVDTVWVDCFDNSTGHEVDTSFFLFEANQTAPPG